MTTLADILVDVKVIPPGAVVVLRGEWDVTAQENLRDALRKADRSDVLIVWLLDDLNIFDVLDTEQMAAAGWVRKPSG